MLAKLNKRKIITGALLLMALTLLSFQAVYAKGGGGLWSSAGQDLENSRHQKTENKIDPDNVEDLTEKWAFTTGGDVSATPAVDGKAVYFPDFAGNLYKLDRETGEVIWQHQISDYTGIAGNFARTTPAIHGNLLIFGDQAGRQVGPGARVMAVNKNTGDLVWVNHVEEHPSAVITQSAVVHGDRVYVGVSSLEELHAAVIPGYECCSFRGSILALDVNTGELIWQTRTAAEGFSGNSVWGSTPVVDTKRGSLYISTGNNYSAPQSFLDCIAAAGGDESAQRACLEPYPDNYFDAVVALDLKTGAVKWANIVIPFDVWTVECLFGLPTCPDPEGPDFDFGQAPMLYSTKIDGKKHDLLGVGQKSGTFWALDPNTGETVWNTQVSPGGVAGGMMWGSASDGTRLYTSSANSEYQSWTLVDSSDTTAGIWSALDPATGEILWQTANPTGANAGGAITVANGVAYACSQDPVGHMYAMEAATGSILWDYESGGSCNSGAAVVNGTVYWGSGYAGFGPPNTGNDQFYAFDVPK